MRNHIQIRADLLKAVGVTLDKKMHSHGFVRRKTSLAYVRNINDTKQQFVVDGTVNPRFHAGCEIYIVPHLRLSITSVCQGALELVNGQKILLANAPEVIMNQLLTMAAPKNEYSRWVASGYAEMCQASELIGLYFEKWGLPLFNDLITASDLVRIYESKDGRVMRQHHWHVFVAAAYLLAGNENGAKRVLVDNLGSPGRRSTFAPAFLKMGISDPKRSG